MDEIGAVKLGWVQWVVRLSIAGLFGIAIVGKISDPEQFLTPLQNGLGLSGTAAGLFFVATVLVLGVLIALLLVGRVGFGLLLSGVFFAAGAAYSVVLNRNSYEGDCGCGISVAPGVPNQLVIHAYQNTASAALCFFLGFRAWLGKGSSYEN